MKNSTIILIIFSIVIIGSILLKKLSHDITHEEITEEGFKVGQVWVSIYNDENPYEKAEYDTLTIIDINIDKEYLQYIRNNGDTCSEKFFWFDAISDTLISNKPMIDDD